MTDMKKDHREATHRAVVWDDSEIRRLQEIEGNPFDAADDALFAAMDQAGLSPAARLAVIDEAVNQLLK